MMPQMLFCTPSAPCLTHMSSPTRLTSLGLSNFPAHRPSSVLTPPLVIWVPAAEVTQNLHIQRLWFPAQQLNPTLVHASSLHWHRLPSVRAPSSPLSPSLETPVHLAHFFLKKPRPSTSSPSSRVRLASASDSLKGKLELGPPPEPCPWSPFGWQCPGVQLSRLLTTLLPAPT